MELRVGKTCAELVLELIGTQQSVVKTVKLFDDKIDALFAEEIKLKLVGEKIVLQIRVLAAKIVDQFTNFRVMIAERMDFSLWITAQPCNTMFSAS